MNRTPNSMRRFIQAGVMTNRHAAPGGAEPSRKAYDLFFADGKDFVYAALNIGGTGAFRYGRCCNVLSPEKLRRHGYLKRDSLNFYMLSDNSAPDVEKLGVDVAPESHKAHLAAIKHASDPAFSAPGVSIEAVICNDEEYIEAIMLGPLEKSSVDLVVCPIAYSC